MAIAGTFASQGQSATFIPPTGHPFRMFNVSLWGTFVATVQIERSFDFGPWLPRTASGVPIYQWTAPASERVLEVERGVRYRLNCTSYTSGTINYAIGQQFMAVTAPTAVPVNTAVPVITGIPQVGQTLTATAGAWMNSPTSFAYQWIRNGVPIGGATASTYVPTTPGPGVTVSVVASNLIGPSLPATSAGTSAVTLADPIGRVLDDVRAPSRRPYVPDARGL